MSHTQVQWARGTSAQVASYTGPAGEVVVDTDDYSLAVQDGLTAGGFARLTPGILPPQGRLTLSSGVPVMTSDVAAATTLYYSPYVGRWCPIFNGTVWQQVAFAETSLALDGNSADSGYQQSGNLFDVFAFLDSGVFTIGTGPAWASSTSRGTGAGTTQLQRLAGLWTNAVSIGLRTGTGSGATVTVAANAATYLGTLYATANGETAMQFAPTPAAGGTNNMLALYNAYNRVDVISKCIDSTGSWTYGGASYRPVDNSTANRVTWVDGLGEEPFAALYRVLSGGGALYAIAIAFNSTSGPSGADFQTNLAVSAEVDDALLALGLNYAQPIEVTAGTSVTFNGSSSYEILRVSGRM